MKITLSGATGLLGNNLLTLLLTQNHEVQILTRSAALPPKITNLDIQSTIANLSDPQSLTNALKNSQIAYHVAGLVSYRRSDADQLYETNVIGTRNFLAAARDAGVERVVHVSSTGAIGYSFSPHDILDESAHFNPIFNQDPYMYSKHLAEHEVAKAIKLGQDVVIVNPSTIYGAGDINRNTSAIFPSITAGKILAAPPGGNSVVSAPDVARALTLAMEHGQTGRRYIVSAERLSYLEILNRIARVLNAPPITRTIPPILQSPIAAIAAVTSRIRPNSPFTPPVVKFSFAWRYFSSVRAQSELNWRPMVTFEQAVRAQAESLQDGSPAA